MHLTETMTLILLKIAASVHRAGSVQNRLPCHLPKKPEEERRNVGFPGLSLVGF